MFRALLLTVATLAAFASATPAPSSAGWISMGPTGKPHTEGKSKNLPKQPQSSRQIEQVLQIVSELHRSACTDENQCSFLEQFRTRDQNRWTFAHDYGNGPIFGSWWSKNRVYFNTRRRKMKLSINRETRHGKPYASGQTQSKKWHGYGCYEVRMRPPSQEGLITTFFTYTGKYDHAPGKPKSHNEVDVEFVYKKHLRKLTLQANYFTNGRGGNEHLIPLSFNPTKRFHNYGFRWTSKGIEWYVDGRKVYTARKNTPKIWRGPHKIMMNLWPVSPQGSGWGGDYRWRGSRAAAYAGVRFTRGEKCKIQNNFGR